MIDYYRTLHIITYTVKSYTVIYSKASLQFSGSSTCPDHTNNSGSSTCPDHTTTCLIAISSRVRVIFFFTKESSYWCLHRTAHIVSDVRLNHGS